MSECGLALRQIADKANCMEDASNLIIKYFYDNFIDKNTGEKNCILVRFFKTHPYGKLTPELQEYVRDILGQNQVADDLKCLTLFATAGELPEWNSRYKSTRHKAIPLATEDAVNRIPMISQLIKQLGLHPGIVVQPESGLLIDNEQQMYNVFYVKDALGSPHIPSQDSFVNPFGVKSVIGFGGLLPSGDMFTVLMFLKVIVPQTIVELIRPLALNVKTAILPFDNRKFFQDLNHNVTNKDSNYNELQHLNSQIGTLNQLLNVSEKSTITQSDRLEKAITNLEQTLNQLKKTQIQLVHNEKMSSLGEMVAGIAHEINNPVNFIYANLDHVNNYVRDLLDLLSLYQQHYPEPDAEIKSKAQEVDTDFLAQDLSNILSSMDAGAERIQNIVLSLRNFSRLDEAQKKPVDIHEGIDSTLLILQHRLKETLERPEIKIIKEYGRLPKVECYAAQVNQVFLHILSNAIDALEEKFNRKQDTQQLENKITQLPTIRIHTDISPENTILIGIADNGIGIIEKIQPKIFDPFFTNKPVGKGKGLGLSISYQIIVKKHNGNIKYRTKYGKGTEFLIEIPVKDN